MLNIRLKSVEGISIDFLYLNLVGYLSYTTSIFMLFFNSFVREQYALKYTSASELAKDPSHRHYPLLQLNDVAYTVHGLFCVLILFYQVHFSNFKKSRTTLSSSTRGLLYLVGILCTITIGNVLLLKDRASFKLLDIAELLGYIKVFMSVSKYIPQLIYNHQRKSTKGWAINSTILDIFGGVSSLGQLFLDGYLNNDLSSIWGNTSKLMLALVTIAFDIFFLLQHYVIFPKYYKPQVISLSDFK